MPKRSIEQQLADLERKKKILELKKARDAAEQAYRKARKG